MLINSNITQRSVRASSIIRVIEDWRAFEEIASAWDELALAADGGPFVSYSGLCAWWRTFGEGMRPFIVTVWRDGLLVGSAPLGVARRSLSPRLPLLKVNRLQLLANDYVGFNHCLTAPEHGDAADLIVDAITDRQHSWDLAVLEPYAESQTLERILEAASDRGLPSMLDTRFQATVIDLSRGWADYLSRRSRNFRKSLRAAQRRIAQSKHRILRETDGGQAILERTLALSGRSWKGKAGTAIGVDPRAAAYIRQLWATLSGAGSMKIYLLEVDGEDVGGITLLHHGKTAYALACDFEEEYQRLSPGRFILAHSIEDSAAIGLLRYDTLRRPRYLEGFSGDYYPIRRLRFFPGRTWAYWAIKTEIGLRPIGNAFWNRLRGSKAVRRDLKASR